MASLKALRDDYQLETETVANSAKTATFEKKCSQISHFSRVFEFEDETELQFLRDERAAIREFDGGMSKSRAVYMSVLDVPCLPSNSNNQALKLTINLRRYSLINRNEKVYKYIDLENNEKKQTGPTGLAQQ